MAYAIIKDGPHQLRVEEGQELQVDYRDLPKGSEVRFDEVLAFRDESGLTLGRPLLASAAVVAEVVGPKMGDKLYIQKFRRRKAFDKRTGHRQLYTMVKITRIEAGQPAPAAEPTPNAE